MSNFSKNPTSSELFYSDKLSTQQWQPSDRHFDAGLEKITYVLDRFFRIPGTDIRFGLDPIIGFLLPFAGDSITTLLSIYIVLRSLKYGLPKIVIGRMVFNIALDYVVGSVPLVGDFLDFAFQANKKNIDLLNRFGEGQGRARWTDYLWLFMLLTLLASVIFAWLFFIIWMIKDFSIL
jgi:hypothetical protein